MATLTETIQSLNSIWADETLPTDVRDQANKNRYRLEHVSVEGRALQSAKSTMYQRSRELADKQLALHSAQREFEEAKEKLVAAEFVVKLCDSVPCPKID